MKKDKTNYIFQVSSHALTGPIKCRETLKNITVYFNNT